MVGLVNGEKLGVESVGVVFGRDGLSLLKGYGEWYEIWGSYGRIGRLYNYRGEGEKGLVNVKKGLNYVNVDEEKY